jgi:hypothetical protein
MKPLVFSLRYNAFRLVMPDSAMVLSQLLKGNSATVTV